MGATAEQDDATYTLSHVQKRRLDTLQEQYLDGPVADPDTVYDQILAARFSDPGQYCFRPNKVETLADALEPETGTFKTADLAEKYGVDPGVADRCGEACKFLADIDVFTQMNRGRPRRYAVPDDDTLTAVQQAADLNFVYEFEQFLHAIDEDRGTYAEITTDDFSTVSPSSQRTYFSSPSQGNEKRFFTADHGRERELLDRMPGALSVAWDAETAVDVDVDVDRDTNPEHGAYTD